jgi:hypothetical protein
MTETKPRLDFQELFYAIKEECFKTEDKTVSFQRLFANLNISNTRPLIALGTTTIKESYLRSVVRLLSGRNILTHKVNRYGSLTLSWNDPYSSYIDLLACSAKFKQNIGQQARRADPHRLNAIYALSKAPSLGKIIDLEIINAKTNKGKAYQWKRPVIEHFSVKHNVLDQFRMYLAKINNKSLVFQHKENGQLMFKDYKTRFNDPGRMKRNMAISKRVNENALERHKHAVFLTLTIALYECPICGNPLGQAERCKEHPKEKAVHRAIYPTNKAAGKGWNQFLSWLQSYFYKTDPQQIAFNARYKAMKKELPEGQPLWKNDKRRILNAIRKRSRPEYMAAYEFTQSGYIHIHALIFGHRWIGDHAEEITPAWEKTKMGSVHYEYVVYNTGTGWRWKKNQPKDAESKDASQYLLKYIQKAMYDDEEAQFMYWAHNKRYFTYSRALSEGIYSPHNADPDRIRHWVYLGSEKFDTVPREMLAESIDDTDPDPMTYSRTPPPKIGE